VPVFMLLKPEVSLGMCL